MRRTEATANCAEPAHTVADMTIATSGSMPADLASTPNDTPKTSAATANGRAAVTPSRMELRADVWVTAMVTV